MKILAVDPGSRIAGFACLESTSNKTPLLPQNFRIVDAGALHMDIKKSHAYRIGQLHSFIFDLIGEIKPDVFVLEKAFAGVNVSSALKLGETRGALISAAIRHNIDIVELTPASVKKTITGNGRATKEEVSMSLKMLIGFDIGKLPYDVSDAVALSLCYGVTCLD